MSEQHPNTLIEHTISDAGTAGRDLVSTVGGQTLPALRSVAPRTPANRHPLRKLLLVGVGALALAGAADFGWDYWTVGRFQVSTDDAYVKADSTAIAPKVSGYIAGVLVRDNEPVKAGQILAKIDDRDFRVALDQANADLEAAKAAVATKEAALNAQRSVIDGAQATTAVDQATLLFAEQENKRYSQLASNGYGRPSKLPRASRRAMPQLRATPLRS